MDNLIITIILITMESWTKTIYIENCQNIILLKLQCIVKIIFKN